MADDNWLDMAKEEAEELRVRNSDDLFTLPRANREVSALSYIDGTNSAKTIANPNIVRTNKAGIYVRKSGEHTLIPWHGVLEVKLIVVE